MGLGAIVVVGAGRDGFNSLSREVPEDKLLSGSIESVEILGRSTLERMIERLVRADVEAITILVPRGTKVPVLNGRFRNVAGLIVDNMTAAITQQLTAYAQKSIDHSFIVAGNLYAESDMLDLFYFHREARQTATRAVNRDGGLDLWVVDCAKAQSGDFDKLLAGTEVSGTTYFIRDYVVQLREPRDLRKLANDALSKRCALRPGGIEIRTGVWVDEGADVHKRARIIAPAYIGRNSTIEEDTLITRCSSIERNCCIDCGTVIEDSSILANTQIGIWLDVCHAVVNGNRLLSLGHEVLVEISDPNVMHAAGSVPKGHRSLVWNYQQGFEQRPVVVADLKKEKSPRHQPHGLEPILSRGGD